MVPPFLHLRASTPSTSVNPPRPPAAVANRATLLVVDDEAAVRAMTSRMLEHLGYRVILAESGSEALELHAERGAEIDLVLADLTMPGMDGAELIRRLRARDPAVRVVLTSGFFGVDIEGRLCFEELAGMLQKPFSLGGLQATVQEALRAA